MNYILKKVEVNGNADRFGGSDDETEISSDVEKLKEYCRTNFNCEPYDWKSEKLDWVYFKIVESQIVII